LSVALQKTAGKRTKEIEKQHKTEMEPTKEQLAAAVMNVLQES